MINTLRTWDATAPAGQLQRDSALAQARISQAG